MGYPTADAEFVKRVIEEESAHQTSLANVERDLRFLRANGAMLISFLKLLIDRGVVAPGRRGLEVGAGSGWPSWLFAQAGCEMWMCELEANSLASGLAFTHQRIPEQARIACDARYLPFADEQFDLVLSKEFAHHIEDKASLFREINRVLRPNGILILLDPVRSLNSLRDRDDHFGHSIVWPSGYTNALEQAGFDVRGRTTNYHWYTGGRFPATHWIRRRSRANVHRGRLKNDLITRLGMTTLGGTLLAVARKETRAALVPRPPITVLDPASVRWFSDGYDRSRFVRELEALGEHL